MMDNLKQFRGEIEKKFENEFLDKIFPKGVDLLMPDMDSRGFRQRGKDFLSSALDRQLSEFRQMVEEMTMDNQGWIDSADLLAKLNNEDGK